ncbi:MAG: endopeptidase La [Saprospiraceae bacterium]|nr:endopeptidase La [Saprospiraceae bacterium]
MFEDILMTSSLQEDGEFIPILTMDEDESEAADRKYPDSMPILPLKNTVLFPGVVIPITVGRDKSLKSVNSAHKGNKYISVHTQLDVKTEDPTADDIHMIGTIARVVKLLKMPDGNTTAILQGTARAILESVESEEPYIKGKMTPLIYEEIEDKLEFEAMVSSLKDMAKQIIELSPNIPSEAIVILKNIDNNIFLMNFIASNLNVDIAVKQSILENNNLLNKARQILELLHGELQLLEIKGKIEGKVRQDIEKQQRDYFLNQQLKTIQEELGQVPGEEELKNLAAKALTKKWNKDVAETFEKEFNKIRRINPQFAEYSVQLNYLNLLLDLPWNEYSTDNFDLARAKKILDADHFGLEKVKDRILEHLAVLKLKDNMKAPILCLVGPPGVGKTSLGKSIARALKRKYIRISLGGLYDESEIRGHRKTYIGAMPGRIITSVKKAATSNPVFILDEIDKIGKDFRGDPSSALLEVLDPEQNSTFHDNYLEMEYDLSKVLFIATANSLTTIQPALLDRMEIIDLSGYSVEEKIEIAKKHLLPDQLKEHGLQPKHAKLEKKVLEFIIQSYTRESGVRSLDRRLAAVMRNAARKVAMKEKYNVHYTIDEVRQILGPERYQNDLYEEKPVPGVTVGLAWTSVGGDILFVEASLSKGKGKMTLTGNLGDVMKESASTALSFIKAHASNLLLKPEIFDETDIHIHVPEGAIPKDGPSAGVTMLTSLASAYTKRPVKQFIAMTGEITLRGKVLPVGGIKEKILAAKRAGIKEIILSTENRKHIQEIEPNYLDGLNFVYVDRMEEVLQHAIGLWDF